MFCNNQDERSGFPWLNETSLIDFMDDQNLLRGHARLILKYLKLLICQSAEKMIVN